jgi:hypothetical protein
MERVSCPHCNANHSVHSNVPQNAVVVVQCPDCSEWSVCFQNKICALDRKILEEGSSRERKLHLAKIIAEFLEPMLSKIGLLGLVNAEACQESESDDDGEVPPISDKELRDFVKFDLKRLDNPEYFRKNLG